MPIRTPELFELTLYYQEPFQPVEAEGIALKEPLPAENKLCRYALTLSQICEEQDSLSMDSAFDYPCEFIPYLIDSLTKEEAIYIWLILDQPEEVQIAAFHGNRFLGAVFPIPVHRSSASSEFTPYRLLVGRSGSFKMVGISRRFAWPGREDMSLVIVLRHTDGELNNKLLKSIQINKQEEIENLLWITIYPQTLQQFLLSEASLLYRTDNIRGLKHFIYTAHPILETLEVAILQYIQNRRMVAELVGLDGQIRFTKRSLNSFEYWRRHTRIYDV